MPGVGTGRRRHLARAAIPVVVLLLAASCSGTASCSTSHSSSRRSRAGSVSTVEMPTRMAPRSRRCRVSARVSTPLIPTTPWATSSSSRLPVARQLAGRRAGSRAAEPAPPHT